MSVDTIRSEPILKDTSHCLPAEYAVSACTELDGEIHQLARLSSRVDTPKDGWMRHVRQTGYKAVKS